MKMCLGSRLHNNVSLNFVRFNRTMPNKEKHRCSLKAYFYYNLTLSNSSGINSAGGNIQVGAGTLKTTVGGTLDMTALYILTGTLGTITNNGTIKTVSMGIS